MVEITSEEQNKIKRMKRTEDSLRDFWGNIKCTNIQIIVVPEEEVLQSAPRSSFPLNQSISLRLSSASAVSLTDSINEDCCLNKALHLTKALLVLLLNILNKGTRNLEGLWGLQINMDSLHILLAMRC